MARYQNAIHTAKNLAYTGLGVGFGIAGANVASAIIAPRIPIVNNTPIGRVATNAIVKIAIGGLLGAVAAPAVAKSGHHFVAEFVKLMSYGALGAAFSDVVTAAVSRVVPVPSVYGASVARPMQPTLPHHGFRPQAHVTPARASMGGAPVAMGPSVGPSIGSPPRMMNANLRPNLVRVSVPNR